MKKNGCHLPLWPILLASLFVLSYPANAQNKPFTLQLKNVPLLAALDSIRHQAGYQFSYNLALTSFLEKTRVSIQAPIHPIETVLTKLLAGTGIKHRIIDKTVLLSKADTLPPIQPNSPVPVQTVKGKVVD